jgi:dTDP-4-amino-4,6-dideoxygalactose transaminase
VAKPLIGNEEIEAVKEVLLSGNYVSGKKVREFEEKFAGYYGVKYAVAVNSGTAALHVALTVLGVGFGDEVIVPPLTFFSTVSAVLHQYGVPVFADIDPASYCIDPADVEKKITKKTKAIIPVHLYGNSAQMDEIIKIARRHQLKIIEDCAQAHGTEYKGQKVGSIGDIGAFSFFATKHMTTGEGGMLITNNKEWAEKARMIRSHGMSDRDHHDYLGYNYRMNEIAAAMGIEQLKKLDHFNDKRIENSLYLIGELEKKKIPWLKTPLLEKHIKHTFFWCPILVNEEKLGMTTGELRKYLRDSGIETRHRYWEPLYKQKILLEKYKYPHRVIFAQNDVDYSMVYLEHVESIAGRLIGLPNHPGLKKQELDKIIEALSNN